MGTLITFRECLLMGRLKHFFHVPPLYRDQGHADLRPLGGCCWCCACKYTDTRSNLEARLSAHASLTCFDASAGLSHHASISAVQQRADLYLLSRRWRCRTCEDVSGVFDEYEYIRYWPCDYGEHPACLLCCNKILSDAVPQSSG